MPAGQTLMDYSLGLAAGQGDKDSPPAPRPRAVPLTGQARCSAAHSKSCLQLIFDLTYKNNEISREADRGCRGALIHLWAPGLVLLFGSGVENWRKPPWSSGGCFCSLLCPWTRSQPGSPAKSSTSEGVLTVLLELSVEWQQKQTWFELWLAEEEPGFEQQSPRYHG